ncbi:MAG: threonine--tRNA ligase [Gaiellales bacterium]
MKVHLPDGTELELADGATGLDCARAIGERLAKATAAIEVDGEVRDLRLPLPDGAHVRILRVGDEEALPILRHSTAHVLAEAARHVFPGVKISIGPAIDNGFYYDFEFPEQIGEADLVRIEDEMRRILKQKHAFTRETTDRETIRQRFVDEDEAYKVELIDDLPVDEPLTVYTQDDFTDLCRGPHLQDTAPIKAFKLTHVAGAYWRGDSTRTMLTRVYGTAFFTQEDLDQHLHNIEEAQKRDHRRLGRELDLFSFNDVSPGAPFWHPKGMIVWNTLVDMWRGENSARGYQEVKTPILYASDLWKTSGHWDKFRENMYLLEIEERAFGMKPMNCPAHCMIFKSDRRSYRELPLRMNEVGLVHRHEPSGTLHGLMRVRHITQDDAHLFVTTDQIEEEVQGVLGFALDLYELFAMDFKIELSTRPEVRVGDDAIWDKAEEALHRVLQARGIDYRVNEGDGAFYGPKIDIHLTDSLGRSWQCGTVQLDFNLPQRFELTYTGADDHDHRPVMIHRALLGSFERFIGILIEHYGGAFPLWLAPVQAVILPISDRHIVAAELARDALQGAGLRAQIDARGESIGKRIAEAETQKVPAMLVIGDREAEAGAVAVRRHGRVDLGTQPLDAVIDQLATERDARTIYSPA